VERAGFIIEAAKGRAATAIASDFGVDPQRPRRWCHRWVAVAPGLAAAEKGGADDRELRRLIGDALLDAARPGAPPTFSAETVAQLISLACEPPEDSGLPITHWTPAELAKEAQTRGMVEAISPRHLDRLLKRGRAATAQEPLLDDLS
jgi:hypothetical protein